MRILFSFLFSVLMTTLWGQPTEATLLGHWDRSDLLGSSAYDNTYNEVWGMAVNGREYAVIGSTAGTHFIDLSDPANLVEVAFVAGAAQGGQIIHRDYHNYGCYLYAACDEGASSLQIIDCSNLPESVEVVYDSDVLFRRVHNIFIDTATAKLYALAVGGSGFYDPLRIYDISDPVAPVLLGSYENFGGLQPSHVHDAYVKHDTAFLNCGYSGMAIVDFSDTDNPVTLGTVTSYPFAGYNHSGWATDDMQYYYLGDENHGYRMKVFDISDPSDVTWLGNFNAGSQSSFSIPHNQIVACNYLYVSYYYDGLQIYDISNPTDPQRVSYYPTSSRSYANTYEGAWGVYPFLPSGRVLVSDMQEGLFLVEGPGDDCPSREESALTCGTTASREVTEVQELTIFPQPASGELTVRIILAEAQQNVKGILLDINGRPVQRFPVADLSAGENRLVLPLDPLAPGCYLLRLQGEGVNLSRKVMIY